MGALLNEQIAGQVREALAEMKAPVHMLFFEKAEGCDYCPDTRQLVTELAELSEKITLSVYDVDAQPELAQQYRVDKLPGIVLAALDGDQTLDYGVRYAGIPAGHEFTSLINDLMLVSQRDSGLKDETRAALAGLKKPVHLQVFVTPT